MTVPQRPDHLGASAEDRQVAGSATIGSPYPISIEAAPAPEPPAAQRVGAMFIVFYMLAFMSTCLLFLAPMLVTLPLKVNALVGSEQAPGSLALIAGTGALLAVFANPLFGKLSDRTSARLGMRRPWMIIGVVGGSLGVLVVALAPSVAVVLLGWCVAQLFFNALLAAEVAVLADQVPEVQRGLVAGVLGVCVPIATAVGTYVVKLFAGNQLAMFLAPCALGGFFVLLFAVMLRDRRLPRQGKPPWSVREVAGIFYVSPRKNPDFAWVFSSRFLFVMAYAFLTTFQAYYLLHRIGSAAADVPQQIFLATLVNSAGVVVASLAGGRLSDRIGRRKVFVGGGAVVYGLALFAVAFARDFNSFLVGMAVAGFGFGMYMAVDLALVVDVLPDSSSAAKDLGVFNIAGALPSSRRPSLLPSCRLAAAATACSTRSRGSAPSARRSRSRPFGVSGEPQLHQFTRGPKAASWRPCSSRSQGRESPAAPHTGSFSGGVRKQSTSRMGQPLIDP